jgi:hypothetical protein
LEGELRFDVEARTAAEPEAAGEREREVSAEPAPR